MRILFAKLTLNRLELFAQEVFTLALIHLRAHVGLNLPLDLEDFNLSRQKRRDVLQSSNHIDRLEQLLALLSRHVRRVRRHVGEQTWIADVLRSNGRLRRHWCARGDVRLYLRLHAAHQRFDLNAGDFWGFNDGALQHERGTRGVERLYFQAALTLHYGAQCAVGKVHYLGDLGERAHRMQLVDRGDLFLLWLPLGDQRDPAASGGGGANGGNALVAANLERCNHLGEDDDLAKGNKWEGAASAWHDGVVVACGNGLVNSELLLFVELLVKVCLDLSFGSLAHARPLPAAACGVRFDSRSWPSSYSRSKIRSPSRSSSSKRSLMPARLTPKSCVRWRIQRIRRRSFSEKRRMFDSVREGQIRPSSS